MDFSTGANVGAGAPQGEPVNLRLLLEEMVSKNASDLHVVAGERPKLRVDGDMVSASVEHVMTPNIEARLLQALGNPTTCPHGNPIPGLGTLAPDEFPLDEARAGDRLAIQRITEEAEEDPHLMKYLQDHGIEPGARVTVREANSFNATVVLDGPDGAVSLGFGVAARLRARRV